MKVAATQSIPLFSCDSSSVDIVRIRRDECDVTFDLRVDAAAFLYNGISTIRCEILSQVTPLSYDDGTIAGFNKAAEEFSKMGISTTDRIVGKRIVDVTACVPNSITRNIRLGSSLDEIRSRFPTRSIVRLETGTALKVAANISISADRKIVGARVDPGSVRSGNYPHDATSAFASVKKRSSRIPASPALGENSSPTISAQSTSTQQLRVKMSVKTDASKLGGCFLRLIAEKDGIEQQVLEVRPSFLSLISLYNAPTIPPVMQAKTSASGRVIVSVRQIDQDATGVTITYRQTADYLRPTKGFIPAVSNVECLPGRTVSIPINVTGGAVLRAYAVKGGRTSSAFSSDVVQAHMRVDNKHSASLAAYSSNAGISLVPIVLDENAMSVAITRKDLRTGIVQKVTETPFPTDKLGTIVDSTPTDLARYEYSLSVYTKSGDYRSGAAKCEVTVLKPRGIVVGSAIASYNLVNNNQTVNIKIDAAVKSNDVNFLISYILASGLSLPFQTDLETLKKSLQNCIKFDVVRYNMTTGETKFVGQTASEIVDDIEDVSVRTNFFYTCEAFISSPSQLTDVIADRANRPTGVDPSITRLGLHLTKLDIDGATSNASTKKSLSNARRFFSRSNFESGTMPAKAATDAFSDGRTGDVITTSVSVAPELPRVTSINCVMHRGKPHIEWQYTGNLQYIDRFQITGDVKGAKWTVATAGFSSAGTHFAVTDDEKHDMPRAITYSVTPIYLSGNPGDTVSATPLVLEEMRSI